MILVIGATGNVGRHVLSQLHAIDAADVRALVRPGKAAHLPDGVDVATGSLDDPDGMTAALTGVKTVFLVWPFLTTEGAPAALEAIGQHAQRLVYLSSIGVGGRPEEQADPIFKLHADMERRGARSAADRAAFGHHRQQHPGLGRAVPHRRGGAWPSYRTDGGHRPARHRSRRCPRAHRRRPRGCDPQADRTPGDQPP